MSTGFTVTIEQFSGPLDLMLHLIKENKLDLGDLDVLSLTNQYIDYIKAMEELSLEIASEYLVELANLLEYKSRKLLPKDQSELETEYQEVNTDDLVARLLEYQKYKEVSHLLEDLAKERQRLLEKPASSLIDQWIDEADVKLSSGAIYQLINAMERCQKRLAIIEPLKVKTTEKEMTVDQRINQVKKLIEKLPEKFTFEELCSDAITIMIIVMTFLAVLEMLKSQILNYQIKAETIYLSRGTAYA